MIIIGMRWTWTGGSVSPANYRAEMANDGVLRKVDAVTVPVPDLETGLAFYGNALGHRLKWRNDEVGQAAMVLPGSDSELVLTTGQEYEPDWLVDDVDAAVAAFTDNGGRLLAGPSPIPVGRVAVVGDPFGNRLVLVELSTGLYDADAAGNVTGVSPTGPGCITMGGTDRSSGVIGVQAHIGDRLKFHGRTVGAVERIGEVVEVRGSDGAPPYLVRFPDGSERLVFPGPDCVIVRTD